MHYGATTKRTTQAVGFSYDVKARRARRILGFQMSCLVIGFGKLETN